MRIRYMLRINKRFAFIFIFSIFSILFYQRLYSIDTDRIIIDSEMGGTRNHFVKTLAGVNMPKLIYGTAWKKERTTNLVIEAVAAGFRGIDTACQPKYYHEPGLGEALKIIAEDHGINREQLFIQTKFTPLYGQDPNKIPYDKKAQLSEQVQQSFSQSLKNLGTTYIDSLLLHEPMRTHKQNMEVWRVFETFVRTGKVKQLGLSNFYNLETLQAIYNDSKIKPSVLQNQFHRDRNYDKEIRKFCNEKGIFYQSFSTLSANPHILHDSEVIKMSKKKEKTPEQLFFSYLIHNLGLFCPLSGTTNKQHMIQDLEALNLKLNPEEIKVFDKFF